MSTSHSPSLEKLLVPAAEAAKMLSMGRSTFWNKVKLRQVPLPVKVGGITRWRVADLRSFVEASPADEAHSAR